MESTMLLIVLASVQMMAAVQWKAHKLELDDITLGVINCLDQCPNTALMLESGFQSAANSLLSRQ